jgi:hypothetical protein
MKFISRWSVPQGSFNAAVERFLITGGAPPEESRCWGVGTGWMPQDSP